MDVQTNQAWWYSKNKRELVGAGKDVEIFGQDFYTEIFELYEINLKKIVYSKLLKQFLYLKYLKYGNR